MEYQELLENARTCIGKYCRACQECNGKACGNKIPGPGAKGIGDTAIRNYDAWKRIRINMDTICENKPVDMSLSLFGRTFAYPFFAAPVGAVNLHYGEKYSDLTYNDLMIETCAKAGIAAFTGDGTNPEVIENAAVAIRRAGGNAIPTIKPWNKELVLEKLKLVKEAGIYAVAMDIDAAGLPILKNRIPPAGSKTVEQLKEVIQEAGIPFIAKGIMTVGGALKAKEAGAAAIVVSNHGGRVLDQCPSTAEVLPEIADAVKGSMKIFVDGGIRCGTDIFKALALGADAVLICRPFVVAAYGGGAAGIETYTGKLAGELADTMQMCGAHTLEEIDQKMLFHGSK